MKKEKIGLRLVLMSTQLVQLVRPPLIGFINRQRPSKGHFLQRSAGSRCWLDTYDKVVKINRNNYQQ